MNPPEPKLQPGVIYSSDNGRLICLHCAGQSALHTGRDISGLRISALHRHENAAWKETFGHDMTCESGCTSYGTPENITTIPSSPSSPSPSQKTENFPLKISSMIPAPSIPFVKGQPFTLVAISSMMAHTTKEEVVITSLLDTPVFRPRYTGSSSGSWRYGTIKHRGKRKEYYLDVDPGTLVFAGFSTVLVDSDVRLSASGDRGFSGNACFNLCGTPEEIRTLVQEKNLNPAFSKLDSIIAIPPGDADRTWYDKHRETSAFPDVESHHAVVQRIREKSAHMPEHSPIAPAPAIASALDSF